MSLHTYAELAEKADEAIFSLLSGTVQSYSIAGRSFTKHDLGKLKEIAEFYRDRANAEKHGTVSFADVRAGGGYGRG